MSTKKILNNLALYVIVVGALVYSCYQVWDEQKPEFIIPKDYGQPPLETVDNWEIRSIDTQIVSRHWGNVPQDSIAAQIAMLKDLGVNYVAIATPYDRLNELKNWVNAIHDQGLNVWFRCHWSEWEGTDGKSAVLTPRQYLDKTSQFIKDNPDLFIEGDAFTLAVEPEQGGVGLGKKFLDWDQYRQFLLDEISFSNEAFESIGLKHKIYTNWISVNGWIVENVFTQELVDTLGMITVDHYSVQSKDIQETDSPEKVAADMSSELDDMYVKWNKPIFMGEWGYQIYHDVSESHQSLVMSTVLEKLQNKKYLVGMNYWTHMGNSARLINDKNGSELEYREAASVLRDAYEY